MSALVPIIGTIGALLGVVVTAVVTAWLGRRAASGTPETSEAGDLWAASRALQEALSAELASARAETHALYADLVRIRGEVVTLTQALEDCHAHLRGGS